MSHRPPPVPPAGRSKKGPAERPASREDPRHGHAPVENTKEQGDQGNIHQNTTNQGHQQDR